MIRFRSAAAKTSSRAGLEAMIALSLTPRLGRGLQASFPPVLASFLALTASKAALSSVSSGPIRSRGLKPSFPAGFILLLGLGLYDQRSRVGLGSHDRVVACDLRHRAGPQSRASGPAPLRTSLRSSRSRPLTALYLRFRALRFAVAGLSPASLRASFCSLASGFTISAPGRIQTP